MGFEVEIVTYRDPMTANLLRNHIAHSQTMRVSDNLIAHPYLHWKIRGTKNKQIHIYRERDKCTGYDYCTYTPPILSPRVH